MFSDDQTELQIRDHLLFMRFRGLGPHDRIPGTGTIWLFRELPGKAMVEPKKKANAARSRVCSAVELVFARWKGRMNLCVRTIGIARASAKIGIANLADNMRRLIWLERGSPHGWRPWNGETSRIGQNDGENPLKSMARHSA